MSGAGLKGPVLSVIVDDIKIMAPKESGMIERVKVEVTAAFSFVDMGLKVDREQRQKTIKLSQSVYIDKVLAKFHLDKANLINRPMKESAFLNQRTEGEASPSEKERY